MMGGRRLLLPMVGILIIAGVVTGRAAGVPLANIEMAEASEQDAPSEKARRRALQLARNFLVELSPFAGRVTLALDVESHRLSAGSCTVYPARGQPWEAEADYVTIVVARSLFGLPARRFMVTCGGNAIE